MKNLNFPLARPQPAPVIIALVMRTNTQVADAIPDDAFNRDETFASSYTSLAIPTLRSFRQKGKGPEYRKLGGKAVRYSLAGLRAWVDAQPRGGSKPPQSASKGASTELPAA